MSPHKRNAKTEWEGVEKWYGDLVGTKGHYYHEHVIFPKLLPFLDLTAESSILDLACGQGVLAHQIPNQTDYVGVDLSPSLIKQAAKNKGARRRFVVADICKPLPIEKRNFSHVVVILALQNVSDPEKVLKNASDHLKPNGMLTIVLNHPCFRIPRQSHWEIDMDKQLQYRRMDCYLSALKIPIQAHPSKGKDSAQTWSFHRPLSTYSRYIFEANFSICQMEEWTSDKKSTGRAARMENRSRKEFPLFLTFQCQKNSHSRKKRE